MHEKLKKNGILTDSIEHITELIGVAKSKHTLTKQSWKCILMMPAARPGFLDTALFTVFLTMVSAEGQVD